MSIYGYLVHLNAEKADEIEILQGAVISLEVEIDHLRDECEVQYEE
jgi:hypothetical protein